MNDFLKSLTAFGMEGMNAEDHYVEAYENSECSEELIELDNLDNMTASMESMTDAIIENGLGAQTMALEAAGFSLDTASGFTGELSTEAIGNMVKRGYYEAKIQIKKALQKIWKLILSVVESLLGAEGRLKSYGKLLKKYKERLQKVHPTENKDGEDKDVTIRDWKSLSAQVDSLTSMGGDWVKNFTNAIKSIDYKTGLKNVMEAVNKAIDEMYVIEKNADGTEKSRTDKTGALGAGSKITTAISKIQAADLTNINDKEVAAIEQAEKDFADFIDTNDYKSDLDDIISDMKDIDSDEKDIYTAKEELMKYANLVEPKCKKDLKFKKNLISLRKAWDRKTGEWKLAADADAGSNVTKFTSAAMRILNKAGSFITTYRLAVSKYYKAVASNIQGLLADMAKVIAKGTSVRG